MKIFVAVVTLCLATSALGELELQPNGLGIDIIEKPGNQSQETTIKVFSHF